MATNRTFPIRWTNPARARPPALDGRPDAAAGGSGSRPSVKPGK